jgi:periplasmic protein TonB
LLILMDGSIDVLDLISGNPLLVPAAGQAVHEARYKPVLLNGEPIAILAEQTVNFTLSQ